MKRADGEISFYQFIQSIKMEKNVTSKEDYCVIAETSKILGFYCTLGCVLFSVVLFFILNNIIKILDSQIDGNDDRVY